MFTMIAAFAEFEREIIRERVRSGLATARANGKRLGRPRRNPDVEQIRALRRSGSSWRAISRVMGIPVDTLRRAFLCASKAATKRVR